MADYLKKIILNSIQKILGETFSIEIKLEKPKIKEHGDLSTNVALAIAKQLKKNPISIADQIVQKIEIEKSIIEKIEIEKPGFINFFFSKNFYHNELKNILSHGNDYGKNKFQNKTANVEFISANPTGPLTVGHGRNAVIGDTVANILEWNGYKVTREYYFNDAGRQMKILGESVRLRYLQIGGEKIIFPDDYYQGNYIIEIAEKLKSEFGENLKEEKIFKEKAETEIFSDIKKTCEKLNICFDIFFNEHKLYKEGKTDEIINEFKKNGSAFEKDGALWLSSNILKSEKDKVIVKSSGEPTYRLPDIAYHREKIRKNYDLIIDILGSDHIATYPDVLAGLCALGEKTNHIKVLIHQFVTILQNGEIVKMSTRKANFVTLDELIDEVGSDVVRYFFLMRSIGSHLNFDLTLAKTQSDENPVYYLQYAHARIASIIRFASEQGISLNKDADISVLDSESEINLIKLLTQFPILLQNISINFEIHLLCEYLHNVAGEFHKFYHENRVVTENENLTSARLLLCEATKTVLGNGLKILGISTPEKM